MTGNDRTGDRTGDGRTGDPPTGAPAVRRAVSIAVAARQLNLTSDAVRLRLKRRTLDGYRDHRGRWMVYVDSARPGGPADQAPEQSSQAGPAAADQAALIEALRARLEALEREQASARSERSAELQARLADRDRALDRLRGELERERAEKADHIEQQKALVRQVAELVARLDDQDRRHAEERRAWHARLQALTDALAAAPADRRSLRRRLFGGG